MVQCVGPQRKGLKTTSTEQITDETGEWFFSRPEEKKQDNNQNKPRAKQTHQYTRLNSPRSLSLLETLCVYVYIYIYIFIHLFIYQ